MRSKDLILSRSKALAPLVERAAVPLLTEAALVVAGNRRLIRKAMRMGHSLDALARALQLPKRTLQRHLNEAGLFFRKPRAKKGHAVIRNKGAILRAKTVALVNV
jgi:hypothetical protein